MCFRLCLDPSPFLLIVCLLLGACTPRSSIVAEPTPDTEFLAAVGQARGTLDEFKERILVPHPDRSFVALKVRFASPDGSSQDIWVDNVFYGEGGFQGSMGDDIPALKLFFGDRISVPEKDIVDWMIVEDNVLIGGYTIRLAYQRMSPREQELFLQDAGYRIK